MFNGNAKSMCPLPLVLRSLLGCLAICCTLNAATAQETARRGELKTWRGDIIGQLARHDSDTFWVGPVMVRLFGIDGPEAAPLCKSIEGEASCSAFAMDGLGDLIFQGANCIAEGDRMDRHNRWLVRCRTQDSLDVGLEMIQQGWACAARKYLKRHELLETYVAAEVEAMTQKRGLWGMGFVFPNMCKE